MADQVATEADVDVPERRVATDLRVSGAGVDGVVGVVGVGSLVGGGVVGVAGVGSEVDGGWGVPCGTTVIRMAADTAPSASGRSTNRQR